jgi:death-on-curing protein
MATDDERQLADLLGRVVFALREPLDLSRTDPETTSALVRVLTAAAVSFNALVVSDFGGRAGPARGEGLVEQVVAAAFQSFCDVEPHPGSFEKAAMLLRGITQGHPFNDGNKRTGFLLAAYYLELAGVAFPNRLDEDAVVDFCLRVSAGAVRDVAGMAIELQRLWGVEG